MIDYSDKKINTMHYAIIEVGGRQLWVENGNFYFINHLDVPPGTKISLRRVLLTNTDGKLQIGVPYLETAHVTGEVVEHIKGPKLIAYKMKSKKKYRRKSGHRQALTKLFIKEITV